MYAFLNIDTILIYTTLPYFTTTIYIYQKFDLDKNLV